MPSRMLCLSQEAAAVMLSFRNSIPAKHTLQFGPSTTTWRAVRCFPFHPNPSTNVSGTRVLPLVLAPLCSHWQRNKTGRMVPCAECGCLWWITYAPRVQASPTYGRCSSPVPRWCIDALLGVDGGGLPPSRPTCFSVRFQLSFMMSTQMSIVTLCPPEPRWLSSGKF